MGSLISLAPSGLELGKEDKRGDHEVWHTPPIEAFDVQGKCMAIISQPVAASRNGSVPEQLNRSCQFGRIDCYVVVGFQMLFELLLDEEVESALHEHVSKKFPFPGYVLLDGHVGRERGSDQVRNGILPITVY